MMSDAAPGYRYIGNHGRIPRPTVFSMGVVLGLLVGCIAGYTVCQAQAQAAQVAKPTWSSSLVCRGRPGICSSSRTPLPPTTGCSGDFVLMQSAGAGLVPSAAMLHVPFLSAR